MAEREVRALKETLGNQSLIIKKLYTELEEERKASATAVEESLSMILRLQEEKAMEKLEACQYKRLAEEKMHHVEESLAILEEAMFQKEIEVASLNYQIQAYKHKLLSISLSNLDVKEMKVSDFRVLKRESTFLDKKIFTGFVRRNMSLPASSLDQLCLERDILDEGSYQLHRGQSIQRYINECTIHLTEESEKIRRQIFSEEHVIKECDSHEELSEKLDIGMKQITQTKNFKQKFRSGSIAGNNELEKSVPDVLVSLRGDCRSSSEVKHDGYNHPTIRDREIPFKDEYVCYMHSRAEDSECTSECHRLGSPYLEADTNGKARDSINAQDTEVLKTHSCCIHCQLYKQMPHKYTPKTKDMVRMSSMTQENLGNFLKSDLNSRLVNTHEETKMSTSSEGDSLNYHLTVVGPEIATSSQTGVEQLKRRMEQLENDIRSMRQEYPNGGKEQFKLLREMNDQLGILQLDVKELKSQECPLQDESSFDLLREAMLPFWL